MSEITPAAKVASLLSEYEEGGWYAESLDGWFTTTAEGDVVHVKVAHHDDDGEEIAEKAQHFRAVVVEGETVPIVLERPATLGLTYSDGGHMLMLDEDGINLLPRGVDLVTMRPARAREFAAQLAAMADAYEAAQEQKGADDA